MDNQIFKNELRGLMAAGDFDAALTYREKHEPWIIDLIQFDRGTGIDLLKYLAKISGEAESLESLDNLFAKLSDMHLIDDVLISEIMEDTPSGRW